MASEERAGSGREEGRAVAEGNATWPEALGATGEPAATNHRRQRILLVAVIAVALIAIVAVLAGGRDGRLVPDPGDPETALDASLEDDTPVYLLIHSLT